MIQITVKARKVGDSIVMTLPRSVLEATGISDGETLLLQARERGFLSVRKENDKVAKLEEATMELEVLQRKLGVPLADLHMFPDGECCLGFNILAPNGRDFIGRDFIERDVTPWLYRLAFVERFGLSHAESQLWATYQHTSGPADYIAGVRQIALAQPQDHDQCSCGTEEHYVRCHKDEVEQCERDGLVTFGAK